MLVQGTVIRCATMPSRENGKAGRRVIQMLERGPHLYRLLNISDMAEIPAPVRKDEVCTLDVEVKSFNNNIQYTYWGRPAGGNWEEEFAHGSEVSADEKAALAAGVMKQETMEKPNGSGKGKGLL